VSCTRGIAESSTFVNIDAGLEATPAVYFQTQELERFRQSISNIAAYNNIDYGAFQSLQLELLPLLENMAQPEAVELVKQLCEKYAWAIRPLSILFATVIGED